MIYDIYMFFWFLAVVYNGILLTEVYYYQEKDEFTIGDIIYQWVLFNILLVILHPFLYLIYIVSIIQGFDPSTLRREFKMIHKDSLRRLR